MKTILGVTSTQYPANKRRRQEEQTLELIRRGTSDKNGYWIPGPLWWLWHCTETFDPHYLAKGFDSPYRTFPRLPYFPWLFSRLLNHRIIFIPKSWEMVVSWSVIGYAVWMCQVFSGIRVLVQAPVSERCARADGISHRLRDRCSNCES